MQREVPENEVKTKNIFVPRDDLHRVINTLLDNKNVLSVDIAKSGSRVKLTVRYAIMDLVLQLGGVDNFIEKLGQTNYMVQ